jgi:steroid delta-isomerase-like uncharacterized protein
MTTPLAEESKPDELVRIACEHVDALSGGEWGIVRATLAPGARYDEQGREATIEGAGRIVELFRRWKQAFPDATGTVASASSSGDKMVALEVTWEGTHTGPLATADGGVPPTRRQQAAPTAFFFTFEGDKIKESRHHFGSLPLLRQVGTGAIAGATREGGETASVPLLVNKEVPMPFDLAAARPSFRRRLGAFIRRHLGARSFAGRRRSVFG